jgi:sugar lactone lactonase YvrE
MIPMRFATAERPLLPLDRASVLFDGCFSDPRLQHPEGVAIGPDGYVWCGSETGDILRIAPDGTSIERVASTSGFTLGLAFDGTRALYVCDNRHAAVFRLDLVTWALSRFTPPGIRIPNYPVVDRRRNRLLVSDSHHFSEPGPGVWAYDLDTGDGGLWYDRPLVFANGMALEPGGGAVLVCETFARRIVRIPIADDGSAGDAKVWSDDVPGLPDGLAFDATGALFCGCYEPSRVVRIPPGGGTAEVYVEDPTAHMLAHPTNIAFDGGTLYTANLGRWHLTRIAADTAARPLWAEVEAT